MTHHFNPLLPMKSSIALREAIRGIFNGTHNPADDAFVTLVFALETPADVMQVACKIAAETFPNVYEPHGLPTLSTDRDFQTGMGEWFGQSDNDTTKYALKSNTGYFEEFDCPFDGLVKAAQFYRAQSPAI